MKRSYMTMSIIVFVMIFATMACSKEEYDVESSLLIGKWKSVYRYVWSRFNNSEKIEDNRNYDKAILIFKTNNKCDYYDPESFFCSSQPYMDLSWGKTEGYDVDVFVLDKNEEEFWGSVYVKEVTSNRLVIVGFSGLFQSGHSVERYEETIYEKQ